MYSDMTIYTYHNYFLKPNNFYDVTFYDSSNVRALSSSEYKKYFKQLPISSCQLEQQKC